MGNRKNEILFFLIIVVIGVVGARYFFVKNLIQSLPFSRMEFDGYVADVMEKLKVPGLAIAIVQNDEVVFIKGYGFCEVGKPERVDIDTIFQIGSCTKAFTAAALGILVDDGKINWNDHVHQYLPDFQLYDPYMTRELMISDLLSHRSGIEDFGLAYVNMPLSRQDLLYKIRYLSSQVPFRVSGVYNNLMYLVAGQIIPAVTGISWDEFVVERIFMPLNMKRSNTTVREIHQESNSAKPHLKIKDNVISLSFLNLDNVAPAGAIISTITDMAQWLRMLVNHGEYAGKILLKADTINQMHSPQSIMGKGYPFGLYGFGWGVSNYNGYKIVSHKGSLDGATCIVGLLPEKKLGVAVVTNLHKSAAREVIMHYIFDLYFYGAPSKNWLGDQLSKERDVQEGEDKERKKVDEERVVGTSPSLNIGSYVGVYHNDLCGDMIIDWKGDHLECSFLSFNGILQHWNNDVFMFDSSFDYPTIGDRFLLKFVIKKNDVDSIGIRISGDKDMIFKKIRYHL